MKEIRMYFIGFDLNNAMATDHQRSFIIELSEMIGHYDFPLLAVDKTKITYEIDKNGDYLKVSLPHRNDESFDLWVAIYDAEAIVFFGNAHQHFEGNEWILKTVSFIIKILHGKLEIHTFYKEKKIISMKTYFVNDSGNREFLSSKKFFSLELYNPFIKTREEIKRTSFQ